MKNSLLPELEAVLCLIQVYLTCQIAFWVKSFFFFKFPAFIYYLITFLTVDVYFVFDIQ